MAADALSDVLRSVRLTGAAFFHVDIEGAWAAETAAVKDYIPVVMPGVEHLFEYHFIVAGRCWAAVAGEPAIRIEQGDIIVFPQGDAHVMSSSPGMRGHPDMSQLEDANSTQLPLPFFRRERGKGDPVQLICGFLGCDVRPFNPIMAALPKLIKVSERLGQEDSWLGEFMRIATTESKLKRPGGESVLSRMSELMFVEVLRRYISSLPDSQTGWLGGLRDRYVGAALNLLHGDPSHQWTVDELAMKVGLSRSALGERFTQLIGHSPMQYLTSWRIQTAARALANGADNIADVAARAGYGSEAAFSRAFKRVTGIAPAKYRSARRSP